MMGLATIIALTGACRSESGYRNDPPYKGEQQKAFEQSTYDGEIKWVDLFADSPLGSAMFADFESQPFFRITGTNPNYPKLVFVDPDPETKNSILCNVSPDMFIQ